MQLSPFPQPGVSLFASDDDVIAIRRTAAQQGKKGKGAVFSLQSTDESARLPCSSQHSSSAEFTSNPAHQEISNAGGAVDDETISISTTSGCISLLDSMGDYTAKGFFFVFAGNGQYPLVKVVWGVLCLLSVVGNIAYLCSLRVSDDDYSAEIVTSLFQIVMSVSLFANVHFLFYLLRVDFEGQLITTHCSDVEAKKKAKRVLSRVMLGVLICFTGFWAVYIRSIVDGFAETCESYANSLRLSKDNTFVLLVNVIFELTRNAFPPLCVYVSAVWIWMCWLKHLVSVDLANSVDQMTIVNGKFMEKHMQLYASMTERSDQWSANNILRVVTCIPAARAYAFDGQTLLSLKIKSLVVTGLSLTFFGFFFYFVIWVSVAAGGYSNDSTYKQSLNAIRLIDFEPSVPGSDEEKRAEQLTFEFLRMNTIKRIQASREVAGLKFAGVLLTLANAVTVGTLISAVISTKI